MRYKTILIDDEPLALQRLERLLAPYDFIEIIDKAANGQEALQKIVENNPDLIFLDIQMPELTGFEVLERLKSSPYIIFSTAYDEYALKAFETNSIDYLMKPVDPKRLHSALEKLQRLTHSEIDELKERLEKLLPELSAKGKKRIQVRIGNHIRFIDIQDIYFLRAADKYVELHTFDEVFLLSQSLNKLQRELPDDDFVRIHRSAILNLNYLEKIIKLENSYSVRMKDKNKSKLPISRNSSFKRRLSQNEY